jgi:hypothetical protein
MGSGARLAHHRSVEGGRFPIIAVQSMIDLGHSQMGWDFSLRRDRARRGRCIDEDEIS